tara:strand:+ start:63587 stop:64069 length:483 start_codon:yes stop_codon:yes gene_type:complete
MFKQTLRQLLSRQKAPVPHIVNNTKDLTVMVTRIDDSILNHGSELIYNKHQLQEGGLNENHFFIVEILDGENIVYAKRIAYTQKDCISYASKDTLITHAQNTFHTIYVKSTYNESDGTPPAGILGIYAEKMNDRSLQLTTIGQGKHNPFKQETTFTPSFT